jgi:hypothetical protein
MSDPASSGASQLDQGDTHQEKPDELASWTESLAWYA